MVAERLASRSLVVANHGPWIDIPEVGYAR